MSVVDGGVTTAWSGGDPLSPDEIARCVATGLEPIGRVGRAVLLIPDATRTIDLPTLFPLVVDEIRRRAGVVDVVVALGTHQPMPRDAIAGMIGVPAAEWPTRFPAVTIGNHEWDRPESLVRLGTIAADEVAALSDGRIGRSIDVDVNVTVARADLVVILGPVFPHEVVGFSGGNKYLFPGVSGPETIAVTHWLGALIGSSRIIGRLGPTPVRRVIDRSAAMVAAPRHCVAVVSGGDGSTLGVAAGPSEPAWAAAARWSAEAHITYVDEPYHDVLAVVPTMYADLWTGAKAMYKLDPVIADGGRITILAPHIDEFSVTHGDALDRIGYHCCDYFVKQWDRFAHEPWGVLAHSTHLRGQGTFDPEHGERCRIEVVLASGVDRATCEAAGLGWADPGAIDPARYVDRPGCLLVPKAGEQLFRLRDDPAAPEGR